MSEQEKPRDALEFSPEQENDFVRRLIGTKLTAAGYSESEGYIFQFDDRIAVRLSTDGAVWYRMKVQ